MDEKLLKASERWIREGKEYKERINAWLDIIYINGEDPDTECPEEPRRDMAEYVLEQLGKYNEEGKHKEFRELFPPDNDPLGNNILNDGRWCHVCKVAMLSDGRILAKLGNHYEWQGVYILEGDTITEIEGLIGFGFSQDKKYFAKVYSDRIDIHEGWDGTVIRSFNFPDGYTSEDIKFNSIELFSDGERVVLVSHSGIFLIDEAGSRLIHGNLEKEEDKNDYEDDENEPERPASVPAEARWNESDNEWELGKRNSKGKPVGEWKWWQAPKGYLCCHTFYEGDDGEVFNFTRYHECGNPSRIGKYVNGEPFGPITWIRSDKPTIEQFPDKRGAKAWKVVSTMKDGYTVEEHYYDKSGNEIQEPFISDVELSEMMKKMGVAGRFYIEKNWEHLLSAAEEIKGKTLTKEDQITAMYYKAYALYEISGRKTDAALPALADSILELSTIVLWPFLSEHNILRSAIRFAYYIKAKAAIEAENPEEAWAHLKEALDCVSPIDKEDMTPYHKMKKQLSDLLGEEYMEDETEKTEYQYLEYPHAAISPDDKYIAVGSQDSSHIVFKEQDGEWIETAHIAPRSEYPNIACFNNLTNVPILALGSCHFRQSGTLGVYVNKIEGLEASGWTLDNEAIWVIDDSKWIFSMYSSGHGFYLGASDGYIWRKIVYNKADYLYIGGTAMSIDISPDRSRMIVGTGSGQVVVLRWDDEGKHEEGKNPRVDPYLITNLPMVDEKRYIFMAGRDPMIW